MIDTILKIHKTLSVLFTTLYCCCLSFIFVITTSSHNIKADIKDFTDLFYTPDGPFGTLYTNCIMSFDDEWRKQDYFLVRTVGEECYFNCEKQCRELFLPKDLNEIELVDTKYVNKELIEQCMSDCTNGGGKSYNVRKPRKRVDKKEDASDYDICSICDNVTDQNCYKPYERETTSKYLKTNSCSSKSTINQSSANTPYIYSNSSAKEGETLVVDLIQDYAIGVTQTHISPKMNQESVIEDMPVSSIYMCGYKSFSIYPTNGTTKTAYTEKNICNPWREIPIDGPSNKWYVKNATPYDTGINLRRGDYLRLNMYGRVLEQCDTKGKCKTRPETGDLNISLYAFFHEKDWEQPEFIVRSLDMMLDGECEKEDSACQQRIEQAMEQKKNWESYKESDIKRSLVFREPTSPTLSNRVPQYFENAMADRDSIPYNKSFYRENTFSGHLNNTTPLGSSRLYLSQITSPKDGKGEEKMNDPQRREEASKLVGGTNIDITWRGCRFQNGELLEYTLIPTEILDNIDEDEFNDTETLPPEHNIRKLSEILDSKTNWYDVFNNNTMCTHKCDKEVDDYMKKCPLMKIECQNHAASVRAACASKLSRTSACIELNNETLKKFSSNITKGYDGWYVAFRIRTLDGNDKFSTKYGIAPSNPQSRKETMGGYVLKVAINDNKIDDGFFEKVIRKVTTQLFGDEKDPNSIGVTELIYHEIIKDSHFINIVRALLLLYASVVGLLFMAGISPISQKEAVNKLVKVGIIMILISEKSWLIFNSYIFEGVIYGMRELIVLFTYYLPQQSPHHTSIEWMPILNVMRDILDITLGTVTWNKIAGMMWSSIAGFGSNQSAISFFIAAILIFACITGSFACLRVLLSYIVAIFIVAILIIVSPLFICFILFETTKEMFHSWLKQLLMTAVEPIFVFGAVSLFATVFLLTLKAVLSFTACGSCMISINLVVYEFCIGTIYLPIFSSHTASPSYAPLIFCSISIGLAILAHTMYSMVDIGSNMANHIISFSGASSAKMASYSQMITPLAQAQSGITSGAAGLLGLDRTSRNRRKNEAHRTAMKKNTELQNKKDNK